MHCEDHVQWLSLSNQNVTVKDFKKNKSKEKKGEDVKVKMITRDALQNWLKNSRFLKDYLVPSGLFKWIAPFKGKNVSSLNSLTCWLPTQTQRQISSDFLRNLEPPTHLKCHYLTSGRHTCVMSGSWNMFWGNLFASKMMMVETQRCVLTKGRFCAKIWASPRFMRIVMHWKPENIPCLYTVTLDRASCKHHSAKTWAIM